MMTRGILVGLIIAIVQTSVSTGALRWAWSKSYFYWVWGGGVLFRMVVFGLTAFLVYRYTELHLVATLLSLVLATTLLLVVESWVFLKPRQNKANGLSSSTRTSSS